METFTRNTLWNSAIGGVVGILLGFVPLVMLVAPLLVVFGGFLELEF